MVVKHSKRIGWILFFAVLVFYLFLIRERIFSYSVISDENSYFYMAKLIGDGLLPYRDFFFAHPPLQMFVLAFAGVVFGFKFAVLKSVAVIATLISAFFLFLIARRYSVSAAVLSVLIFLTSSSLVLISTQNVGVNVTIALMVIGFFFFLEKKYFVSGVFMGLAGLAGVYALPAFFALIIFSFIKKGGLGKSLGRGMIIKRDVVLLSGGFFVSFVLINLIFILLYGSKYFVPVYLYHFLKSSEISSRFDVFFFIIKSNIILFLGLLICFFSEEKKRMSLFYFLVFFFIAFFLVLKRPFAFYYVLVFPFLAVIFGVSCNWIIEKIAGNKKRFLSVFVVFVVLIASFNFYVFNEKNSPVDSGLVVEAFDFVIKNTSPDEEIFGDIYIAPLIAFETGRRISLNEVDTTLQRVKAGLLDIYELLYQLDMSNMRYFIVAENRDLHLIQEVEESLDRACVLEHRIFDESSPVLYNWLFYRCE